MAERVKCILTPNGVQVCGTVGVAKTVTTPICKSGPGDSRVSFYGPGGQVAVMDRSASETDASWAHRVTITKAFSRLNSPKPLGAKRRRRLEKIVADDNQAVEARARQVRSPLDPGVDPAVQLAQLQKANRRLEAKLDSSPISYIGTPTAGADPAQEARRAALLASPMGDGLQKAMAARALQERLDKVLVTIQVDTDPDDADDTDDWAANPQISSSPAMSSLSMGKAQLLPAAGAGTPGNADDLQPHQTRSVRGAPGAENPSAGKGQAIRQPAHVRARQDRAAATAKAADLIAQLRARA